MSTSSHVPFASNVGISFVTASNHPWQFLTLAITSSKQGQGIRIQVGCLEHKRRDKAMFLVEMRTGGMVGMETWLRCLCQVAACISGASFSTCLEHHRGGVGTVVGLGVGFIGLDTAVYFIMDIGLDTTIS